ncbi:DUF742 domain-containing protein [Streptomyces sp. MZ04]|uniref:DUF742 domain-containing protein n=1 Tax=Streptomyces sp. MZ04 TaxID=2559236 RepID=UPI001FD7893E|nr:DUF742 domain-containing protein [Streptomyces sp. MZ04]
MVRPYALTAGRTRPSGGAFDLISIIFSAVRAEEEVLRSPEEAKILALCRASPRSVAEIAADTRLPLGVVRVLLGDLLGTGCIRVTHPMAPTQSPDQSILMEVIHGLRAL